MDEFFQSEIVQQELNDINKMQQEVYSHMVNFGALSYEDRVDHIEMLINLLEKQRVMYTRLSLSDDPLAKKMKEQLEKSVQLMGFPPGTSIKVLFDGLEQSIKNLKQQLVDS